MSVSVARLVFLEVRGDGGFRRLSKRLKFSCLTYRRQVGTCTNYGHRKMVRVKLCVSRWRLKLIFLFNALLVQSKQLFPWSFIISCGE
jgi:hypothetical protein